MVKKGLMVQLWRIQQSTAIISLFFWALTLAGVFYLSYFHELFVNIGLVQPNQVLLGTVILFLLIIITFLFIGLIYDRALKLWREQTDVVVERNPYAREKLMPKEIVYWRRGTVSVMKQLAAKDSAIQSDIDFMEKWIEKSMTEYDEVREAVDEMEKWVLS